MSDFDMLMQQHEMGVAYKRISEEMGPSPQLIAFVNYGLIDFDAAGLESLEVDVDHQLTLEMIDKTQAYELACESLSEKLDWLGTALLTVGVGIGLPMGASIASHQARFAKGYVTTSGLANLTTPGLVVGGLSLAALAAGIIIKVANIGKNVPSYREYKTFVKAFDYCLKADSSFADHIPVKFSEDDWSTFHNNYNGDNNEWDEALNEAFDAYRKHSGDSVVFSKSGWTVSNFKEAVHWLTESQRKLETVQKKYATKINTIKSWVDHNKTNKDPETIRVMKHINKTVGKSIKTFEATHECLGGVKKILDKVGHQFESKK